MGKGVRSGLYGLLKCLSPRHPESGLIDPPRIFAIFIACRFHSRTWPDNGGHDAINEQFAGKSPAPWAVPAPAGRAHAFLYLPGEREHPEATGVSRAPHENCSMVALERFELIAPVSWCDIREIAYREGLRPPSLFP